MLKPDFTCGTLPLLPAERCRSLPVVYVQVVVRQVVRHRNTNTGFFRKGVLTPLSLRYGRWIFLFAAERRNPQVAEPVVLAVFRRNRGGCRWVCQVRSMAGTGAKIPTVIANEAERRQE